MVFGVHVVYVTFQEVFLLWSEAAPVVTAPGWPLVEWIISSYVVLPMFITLLAFLSVCLSSTLQDDEPNWDKIFPVNKSTWNNSVLLTPVYTL
ncbi:hypothetical protein WICPIJ_007437 [Wickerhamomyces pijperi]|uniref:Uncharacterized protein n=1 Tax=Wickerhamomyces pijperi TaxID=599730 RepID=A0A9P8Q060_WICPI|nr:hypothetical protein WICPIJ_007437 [Wickerhamomyces pijperi]